MDNFNHTQSQPFYNTVEFNEAQWQKANDRAISLQNKIQGIYEANPGVEITPYMVQDYLQGKLGKKPNLNSVRRSISNLKADLIVDKMAKTRIGYEGLPEHYYVLHGTAAPGEKLYEKGVKSAGEIAVEMLSNSNLGK